MVNYSFNVVDEHGNIRGVAMIDTKDTARLRLVPSVVASSNFSIASHPVSSSTALDHKVSFYSLSCVIFSRILPGHNLK